VTIVCGKAAMWDMLQLVQVGALRIKMSRKIKIAHGKQKSYWKNAGAFCAGEPGG
jgi:hypothetical protein